MRLQYSLRVALVVIGLAPTGIHWEMLTITVGCHEEEENKKKELSDSTKYEDTLMVAVL